VTVWTHASERLQTEATLEVDAASANEWETKMKSLLQNGLAALPERSKMCAFAVALCIIGALGQWAISTSFVENAVASEHLARNGSMADSQALEATKAALVGSYRVTGTDPDGLPYSMPRTVDISLTPSGALEFDWDEGTLVGVGQLIEDVLAVAYAVRGRTVIAIMKVNADGSLSGNWLRRTDRGAKGTENWRKI